MKSTKVIITIGLTVIFVVGIIFLLILRMNTIAREQRLLNQEKQFEAPTVAVKQEIKRVLIKRQTKNSEEIIELSLDGKISTYTKDMKLIKTVRVGYSKIRTLFESLEVSLESGKSLSLPSGVTVVIETNKGTITVDVHATPNPSGGGNDTIIDTIIDIIDSTLNPTPFPSPSVRPGITPQPSVLVTPRPSSTPNPSALPDYMTAKEFTCDDYLTPGSKPLKISNTYCGLPNQ